MKTKAEIRVGLLPAKDCGPQKLGERCGVDSPLEPAEETSSADTLVLNCWPNKL